MDPLWVVFAFVFGLLARQVGLPPLVGFLAAGFALNAAGVEGGPVLDQIEDAGVTLLLFTIGLKLRIGNLLRPEVWGAATIHMAATIVFFTLVVWGLALSALPLATGLDFSQCLLLAFALSFSSTVFAVKVLEDKGDAACLYGRVAIGVLIMQDIFAVLFMVLADGKVPSLWALLLPALIPLRHALGAVLARAGHGEMLILAGVVLGLGVGAALFEAVGVKGDVGALIVGMLLAPHAKADELYKALMSFKDLFLVAFFLNIGIASEPSAEMVGLAVLLTLAIPVKVGLYLLVFTRFGLSARSSLLSSLSLANYSEFGLIVGAIATDNGWLPGEWLGVEALAVAITFALASPVSARASSLYRRVRKRLLPLESSRTHPEEQPISLGHCGVVVIGMGRVGMGAYDSLAAAGPEAVKGLDRDPAVVAANRAAGRDVLLADVMDESVWERVDPGESRLVVLTTDRQAANLRVVENLRATGAPLHIAATARFDDDARELREAGADIVFDFFADAGVGFGDRLRELLGGGPAFPARQGAAVQSTTS